jgi:uncharacterized protein YgfB (UPF0149 family)
MYEKDPRRDWLPAMPNYKPWQLIDLTPPELDALISSVTTGGEEHQSWEQLTGSGGS